MCKPKMKPSVIIIKALFSQLNGAISILSSHSARFKAISSIKPSLKVSNQLFLGLPLFF